MKKTTKIMRNVSIACALALIPFLLGIFYQNITIEIILYPLYILDVIILNFLVCDYMERNDYN